MAHNFVRIDKSNMEKAGMPLFYFCTKCHIMAAQEEIWADIAAKPFTFYCDSCKNEIEEE